MNTPLTAGTHNLKVQFKRLIEDFSKITDIPKHQCPVDQSCIIQKTRFKVCWSETTLEKTIRVFSKIIGEAAH